MAEDRNKSLSRDSRINREKIDKEKRTVELAFSSETSVERWGENEVLSHDAGHFDFTRINSDHPLLLGHSEWNPLSQIGVIESARVDADKVGRAVVRFSKSDLGEQIFQDVQDGIRKLISVGYDRTGIVESKKDPNGLVTTRYRWMPTHIAIVPVPADMKAGIGREKEVDSKQIEELAKNLTVEQKQQMRNLLLDPAAAPATGGVDEKSVRVKIQTERNERRKELRARGDLLVKDFPLAADKIRSIVDEAVETEEAIGEVSYRMAREAGAIKPAPVVRMAELGMSDKEQKNYSILRGIQSVLRRGGRAENKPDGLEGDVHEEMVKRNIGIEYSGFLVPSDAPVRAGRGLERYQRDSTAGVFGAGGATVATEMVVPIIELLRNRMVTDKLGITTMSGLQGNVVIPRQTAAATAYAVPEIAPLTISTQALDQIALQPHRVGAYNQYSKQLLIQSSIDVEGFLRSDLFAVIALAWDRIVLNGQGANSEPLGIIGTPGVGSMTFGAAATFANMVTFETTVAAANADIGSMAYASTPTTRGKLKSIPPSLTASTYPWSFSSIWARDNTINGYPALASNQIPNNLMVFGVWSQVILALWGGYDVVVNPYTLDINAEVRITVNTFGDVAIRHPQSFCVSADSAAQ